MIAPAERTTGDIVVRLMGGLGNQLFQYAAALSVATRCGCDVVTDVGYLRATRSDETPRDFALEWLVPANQVVRSTTGTGTRRLLNYVARRLPLLAGRRIFTEDGFAYDPRILQVGPGSTLVGYFQSWRYFEDIADDLRTGLLAAAPRSSWFTTTLAELDAGGPWTAVHVRRGDYMAARNASYHGVLDSDYYGSALEALGPDAPYRRVVFSDDPEAAAALVGPAELVIRPPLGSHPMESLALMAKASAFVTANSSFSWWGAWLAGPSVPVACPEPWLNEAGLDERDLRPRSWIAVSARLADR